jgi:hypothetical protein
MEGYKVGAILSQITSIFYATFPSLIWNFQI